MEPDSLLGGRKRGREGRREGETGKLQPSAFSPTLPTLHPLVHGKETQPENLVRFNRPIVWRTETMIVGKGEGFYF